MFEDQQVRTVVIEDEPYWVATDVCRILGYRNAADALVKHVDEEDSMVSRIATPSRGLQNVKVINESGLYSLILRSKLPAAKPFKRWVTSEVLPQIRKTGKYAPSSILPSHLETAKELVATLERVEELKPKAEAHEIRGGEAVADIVYVIRQRLGLTASTLSVPVFWERLRGIGALKPGSREVTDEWIDSEWAENHYSTPIFTAEGINEIERRMKKLRLVS
jgi:prophage antirepressor-like protein